MRIETETCVVLETVDMNTLLRGEKLKLKVNNGQSMLVRASFTGTLLEHPMKKLVTSPQSKQYKRRCKKCGKEFHSAKAYGGHMSGYTKRRSR